MFSLNNLSLTRTINTLTRLGTELAISNERLATGKRVNRASDDPAAIIALNALNQEIAQIDGATRAGVRISSIIDTADGALTEMSTLIGTIETNVTLAAGEADPDVRAVYQATIDSAIDSMDALVSGTDFNGINLLNGDIGYSSSGVDSTKLTDVEIEGSLTTATNSSIELTVHATGAEAADIEFDHYQWSVDQLEFTVTGPDGSQIFSLAPGFNTDADVMNAVNAETGTTGVTAYSDGGIIHFATSDKGTDATVSVEITSGDLRVAGGGLTGSDTGVDSTITVNGQSATVNSTTNEVRFSVSGVSGTITVTDLFLGSVDDTTTLTVSGSGAGFSMGTAPGDRISFGQASLSSSSLGNSVIGYLNTLRTGGANDMSSGNFSTAETIATKASNQVAFAQARFGAVKSNTVTRTSSALASTKTYLTDAVSQIEDLDYALETVNNNRIQLLMEMAATLIGAVNTNASTMISLLM